METIEEQIRQTIPLAQAMDFKILSATPLSSLTLLPLHPNRNHLGTLFGGSLYAACALSSYACLLAALREQSLSQHEIVIVEGKIEYLRPGTGDAMVHAGTDESRYEDFLKELGAKGRARIEYFAELKRKDKVLAKFKGLYQLQKK